MRTTKTKINGIKNCFCVLKDQKYERHGAVKERTYEVEFYAKSKTGNSAQVITLDASEIARISKLIKSYE